MRCAFGDAKQATALVDSGAPALVSFGLAGGLDPSLAPGTLVLADSVVLPGGDVMATDSEWRERIRQKLAPTLAPIVAPMIGSDEPIAEPAAKTDLWRRTGAAAVDTESHAAARAARQAGLPFLILRAIADPAGGRLPPAVRHGIAPGGRMRPLVVLGSALLAPWQIPDLIRLARDTRAGMTSLRHAVDLLGAGFGFEEVPAG